MNPADQPFLFFHRHRIARDFHGRRVIQIPHHINHGSAGIGGGKQQFLPFLIAGILPHVVAVEAEHERQADGINDTFQ